MLWYVLSSVLVKSLEEMARGVESKTISAPNSLQEVDDSVKDFFHGLKLGFKAWFISISSVSAIICICQVLG